MFKDSEDDYEKGEVAVELYARETYIDSTTIEGIYDLLSDGYRVDDDRITDPKNKPIARGDTDQSIYQYFRKWNNIGHKKEEGF